MDLAGMMNTSFRPLGLAAVVAALTLGGPSRDAAAHPRNGGDPDAAHQHEPELNYIYFRDGEHVSMSAATRDIERARRHRQGNERLLWFRDGGHEFVLRDAALLKQFDVVWKPVEELGEAQGKLGGQQGELGRQMGELGAQQGLLGTRQGTLSVRQATLSIREGSENLTDDDRAQLARQRRELKNQMRALEKQMRALERPMKELGERMNALGREMDALGRKMDAASRKAETELRGMLRRAVTSGTAKPVK
jgi:bla regulator protein blaR1